MNRRTKPIRRLAALLTALLLMTMAWPAFAETPQTDAAQTVASASTGSQNAADYARYLERYDFPAAAQAVTLDAQTHVDGGKPVGTGFSLEKGESATFSATLPADGSYCLDVYFRPLDAVGEQYDFSLAIDSAAPFAACETLSLSAWWEDDGDIRTLTNGDQVNPLQKHSDATACQTVADPEGIECAPYQFRLTAGTHTFSVTARGKAFCLEKLVLTPPETLRSYAEVAGNYANYAPYDGEPIVVEAESPLRRNAYALTAKSDQSTAAVSPASPNHAVMNYIGGTTWNQPGSEITYQIHVPKDGLYQLGFAFKQSYVTDGDVYRWLRIDGKTPFAEAAAIRFPYASKWQSQVFADGEGDPCLLYLTAGDHTLSLSATLSDVAEVFRRLDEIVSPLGDLYLDIVMITGESPDANRDYELQNQIPGFEQTLRDAYENMEALRADLETRLHVNGELGGALKNMARIVREMCDNLYDAHLQVPSYSSAQQTLSAWLYDIKNMSLSLDRIVLCAPDRPLKIGNVSLWERLRFFLLRYADSYTSNAASIESSDDDAMPSIKLWVNWGRDQVKVLNALIQDSFTPQNGVNVKVEQVNATLVQGVISNNSPDLYLNMARTEPVNLAMRGVLYDLRNFPDLEQVLAENFYPDADVPYRYHGGLYALPDTQNFFVTFYRTDIFDKLGLSVPKTWEDFLSVTGLLQRNKMNAYLPYTKLGAAGTVNVGAGGLTIFPTMLMQRNASLYNDALDATNLAGEASVDAFKFWTSFYTEYSLDQDANFYQKFRVGTMPLGIASYTQYLTFRIGAPEITGKWAIAPLPGMPQADGSVNNICSGAGTGVSIMRSCRNKDAAWAFVKWWVSAETQYRYSAEVEAILGESGRISSANPTAVSRLAWDDAALSVLLEQWDKVREIPEVPGSYYVSRSIDQAFWATKNGKRSAKEAILDWAQTSDKEIARKIREYAGKEFGG